MGLEEKFVEFGGERGVERYFFLGDRMHEFDVACEQGYPAIGVASSRTIFQVSLDGMACGRQLGPYLMFPAGEKIYFQYGITLAVGDDTVFQDRFLCILVG